MDCLSPHMRQVHLLFLVSNWTCAVLHAWHWSTMNTWLLDDISAPPLDTTQHDCSNQLSPLYHAAFSICELCCGCGAHGVIALCFRKPAIPLHLFTVLLNTHEANADLWFRSFATCLPRKLRRNPAMPPHLLVQARKRHQL
jgi:hypothetical protein